MPIKFVNLLQDSFYFMRNQWQFSLTAVCLLTLLQLLNLFFSPSQNDLQIAMSSQNMEQLFPMAMTSLGFSLLGIFLNALFILNIHSITQGQYRYFFSLLPMVIVKLFGVVVLLIFSTLFFSLGAASSMLGNPIISLPLMAMGIYFFIKLSLANFIYLIDKPQKSIGQTIRYCWATSRGRMKNLILFCVLYYLVQGTLNLFLLLPYQDQALNMISILAFFGSALMNMFMLIFAFRFYQAYYYPQAVSH